MRRRHGFMLIEVLVALAVLGALLDVFFLPITARKGARDDQAAVEALLIARAALREVELLPFAELAAGGDVPDRAAQRWSRGPYRVHAGSRKVEPGLVRLSVRVEWESRRVELAQLRAQADRSMDVRPVVESGLGGEAR